MPIKTFTPLILAALASAPTSPAPVAGEMYYDTTIGRVGFYSGSAWTYPAAPGAIATASSAPSGYATGRMYYDTTLNAVGIFNGTAFQYLPMGVTSSTTALTAAVSSSTGSVALTFNPGNVALSALGVPTAAVPMNGQQLTNALVEVLSAAPTTNLAAGRVYFDTTLVSFGVYTGATFGWQYDVQEKGNPAARTYANGGNAVTTSMVAVTSGYVTTTGTGVWASGGATIGSTGIGVPTTGYYQVNAQMQMALTSGTTGWCDAGIFVNGTLVSEGSRGDVVGTSNAASHVSDVVAVTAGQIIQLGVRASATSTLITGATTENFLSVALVSR
jgi:hypothetical protein